MAFTFPLAVEQAETIRRAADIQEKPVSVWIRDTMYALAQDVIRRHQEKKTLAKVH